MRQKKRMYIQMCHNMTDYMDFYTIYLVYILCYSRVNCFICLPIIRYKVTLLISISNFNIITRMRLTFPQGDVCDGGEVGRGGGKEGRRSKTGGAAVVPPSPTQDKIDHPSGDQSKHNAPASLSALRQVGGGGKDWEGD